MDWREVQNVFPEQIVLIEALTVETKDTIRKILDMSVISTYEDSSAAWKAYKSIHAQHPYREIYIFHTSRDNIDVIEENGRKKSAIKRKLHEERIEIGGEEE